MDEKPRRRRFRFGLIALFALIAAVGRLASLWNPFPQRSKSQFRQIEPGMTVAEVTALVGGPDTVVWDSRGPVHEYRLGREQWLVQYAKGRVSNSGCIFSDPPLDLRTLVP